MALFGAAIQRMSSEEVEDLFRAGPVVHATLTPNTVIWVPYGWVPMSMACPPSRPGESRIVAGLLPLFNQDLCHTAGQDMHHFYASLTTYEIDPDSHLEQAWRFVKDCGPVVVEWLSTALELSSVGEQSSDGEHTAPGTPRVGDEEPGQFAPLPKRRLGAARARSSAVAPRPRVVAGQVQAVRVAGATASQALVAPQATVGNTLTEGDELS